MTIDLTGVIVLVGVVVAIRWVLLWAARGGAAIEDWLADHDREE